MVQTLAWVVILCIVGATHGFRLLSTQTKLPVSRWTQKKVIATADLSSIVSRSSSSSQLQASSESSEGGSEGFDAASWLNINTRGGIIVWSVILTLIPVGVYNYFISQGYEDTTVGAYVGALFVLLSMVGWASTYIFRVATKDMTYAKQLRDYENAVLQKRLEELADDEIDALMKEIELEDGQDVANADK